MHVAESSQRDSTAITRKMLEDKSQLRSGECMLQASGKVIKRNAVTSQSLISKLRNTFLQQAGFHRNCSFIIPRKHRLYKVRLSKSIARSGNRSVHCRWPCLGFGNTKVGDLKTPLTSGAVWGKMTYAVANFNIKLMKLI